MENDYYVKKENVVKVEAASSTRREGGVWHAFGTRLVEFAQEKYYQFFDVLF